MTGTMKNYPVDESDQFKKAFGEVLRELREERGFSQQKLADDAKLHRNHVGFMERGNFGPSLFTVFQLAPVLKVSAGEFVTRVEARLQELSARPTE